jgi:hypothetical protein
MPDEEQPKPSSTTDGFDPKVQLERHRSILESLPDWMRIVAVEQLRSNVEAAVLPSRTDIGRNRGADYSSTEG